MLLEEARSFIEMMYRELNYNPSIFDKKNKRDRKEIEHTGTYTHTLEELSYGAKLVGVTLIAVLDAYFGIL